MERPVVQPITRAAVISTGTVRIRPDHARRSWKPLAAWLLTSRRWTDALPINVYVFERDGKVVLFDAGQDYRSVSDPSYFPRGVIGWLFGRLARFSIRPNETVTSLLRDSGFDPSAVTHVVLSHLHQDHIGAVAEFPDAEIITTTDEWAQLARPGAILDGYMKRHIDLPGTHWKLIDFAGADGPDHAEFGATYDLFGDSTFRLISTPGHTPGSLSMLVSVGGKPTALLVGDLTYDAHCLDADHIPGVGHRQTLEESTRKVAQFVSRQPDVVVAAAHDPSAAAAFRRVFDEKAT